MNPLFEQKKVVIAGGTSGIGLAAAQLLIAQKANVTITGRNAAKLELAKQQTGVSGKILDSSDRAQVDTFFREQGKIDHLIIALSGSKGGGVFAELPLQDLRDGFEGKFWPQLNTLQAAIPYMNTGGSITLITAISAVAKLPGFSGLTAINGALELMVPVLAKELMPLRINAVSPGVTDTPWWDFLPADAKQEAFAQYATQIPVGMVARPEVVAEAVLFAAGNVNTTGTIIRCDGGLSS